MIEAESSEDVHGIIDDVVAMLRIIDPDKSTDVAMSLLSINTFVSEQETKLRRAQELLDVSVDMVSQAQSLIRDIDSGKMADSILRKAYTV